MFSALYHTSIYLYQGLLQLIAPLNPKAKLWVDGRRNWSEHLAGALAGNTAPVAWFHAASLGEFEQGRPVIEAFRQQYPAYKILLTFFSPSGYEVRKHYAGADIVAYLPSDTPANARRFVQLVHPAIAFFIKYEFWANYLHELRAAQVPVISFSTIFRPGQLFFKSYGGFYRSLLRHFDHILVQNEVSVRLLDSIGITRRTLAGDTRFDRVKQVADQKKEIPVAAAFRLDPSGNPVPVLVVGSAWQQDMEVLIPFLNGFTQPLKVIIAPHEIHDDEIEKWRQLLHKTAVRYSQITAGNTQELASADVLIIDNIGMLSSLYQYGQYAYIGGAFGKGLHNILEAATFSMPLFFGPNYRKFQEAIDLIDEGGAVSVSNTQELAAAFGRLYTDEPARQKASATSRSYVVRNIGATDKVMHIVNQLLPARR
ncbi:3-deoxy-D-manno-octulosonic acid transferase [Arsenicibacter rosenii]|uniref:3-deoxy-D-manno-octulosonic acid transferase n=1 Tax=Arsenicibacter rosenii TaxID=1750698 RepID=A0A1S2VN10_9BACT|nr:glycosyltransferase N-terminal domain-containing protein [Arsenicibacter rosenii]OIN60153.1 3-deoxy-D-manno-octulosonic acid transferase [Arsenicibacter rosenii]